MFVLKADGGQDERGIDVAATLGVPPGTQIIPVHVKLQTPNIWSFSNIWSLKFCQQILDFGNGIKDDRCLGWRNFPRR